MTSSRPALRPHRPAFPGLVLLAALATAAAAAGAAEPHPFTARDLAAMQRISDPQVAPDGRSVAFVVRHPDVGANEAQTDLWLVELDAAGRASGPPRRLTTSPQSDSEPRWSPDTRALYFVSGRSGSSQVWRLPIAGGESVRVTGLPVDVANLRVAPGGSRIAFTAEVFPGCPRERALDCTSERLAAEEESGPPGRVFEELLFRHWDAWKDGRRSHLFTLALGPDGLAAEGARPADVSGPVAADVPSKPFGGAEEYAFTPGGETVIFTARAADREEAWSTNFDLWAAPADGSGEPRNLTADNPAWDTLPVVSPDGSTLAHLAMARAGFESDRFRVVLRDLGTGRARTLSEGWDRSPGSLAFSPDGHTLYATAGSLGQVPLFAVDAATGEVRELVAGGHVRSPGVAAGAGGSHRIVFGRDSLTSPVELWSVAPDGSNPVRLTEMNREELAAVEMGEPEPFTFAGWNGETVHGWVVKPAEFRPGTKYPIAFLIHGGPQGSFGDDFHYRWNPQTYAGAGYGVVTVDFHGSTGYGQAFTDSITGDWGGKPLVDLQMGLAAAIERYPWLDGDRACALGASYGGYMVNWIAGNWPDRFRCLVNHDGLFDLRMMYYTTEELWFPEWEHGGPYFANPEGHELHNPVHHVEAWKTPMLVIHGARDFRVPETQGFATFTALQRRGVPSKLLYFPEESHWVLDPAASIQWHEEVLAWLDRWLG